MTIEIVCVADKARFEQLSPSAVVLFQEVFGDTPWNEGYYCPACDREYPLYPPPSLCCGVRPELCFPDTYVMELLRGAFDDPLGALSYAVKGEKVVGLNWCGIVSAESLSKRVCGRDPALSYGLIDAVKTRFAGQVPERCVVLKETAVAVDIRGQRLSTRLVARSLAHLLSAHEVDGALMQTKVGGAMHHLRKSLGFQAIWTSDSGEMVIMHASKAILAGIAARAT